MDWIDIIVGALGGGGIGTLISRILDRRAQRRRDEMQALREARTPLYKALLKPWAAALAASRAGRDPVQAAGSANSPDYHLALFEFAIVASDDLVRSFSRLMFAASLYENLPTGTTIPDNMETRESLLGDFIWHLRRDLGPSNTRLERDDVIRVLLPSSGNADLSDISKERP
ncbi:hypothetical protein [Candidatus Palauibacter sp.]|uniref:hypothetical protein n=1 Tax=Candidatus Palauibacter sp. TaxID=3101350 RepID=UPI003D13BBF6